jgi:hypothetical protein
MREYGRLSWLHRNEYPVLIIEDSLDSQHVNRIAGSYSIYNHRIRLTIVIKWVFET